MAANNGFTRSAAASTQSPSSARPPSSPNSPSATQPPGTRGRKSRPRRGIFRLVVKGVVGFGHRWLSLLLGALLGCALWGLLTSPDFYVSRIAIRRITPPTLAGDASLVRIQSFTGLVGRPIFLLDPGKLGREIARLPAVADARLFLVLPGQAIVEMAERQPKARWIASGHVFLVSDDGEILGSGDAPELPITIIDTTGIPLGTGDRVDASAVQMAFSLRDLLADAGLRVKAFRYSAQEGLSVEAEDGWVAKYGSADRILAKTQELLAVLHFAREQQIALTVIDLQPSRSPTFRA